MWVYPAALLAWRFLNGRPEWNPPAFGTALVASAGTLFFAARNNPPPRRTLYAWMAYSLIPWALTEIAGANRAFPALASLLPLAGLLVLIYRLNVLDLLISRRILFLFTLSAVSVVYLVVVRFLAGWLESEFGTFGPVVETALILGAAVTWLPMYQVIARFFSRPSRIHVEFSRRVIEEATGILDLRRRALYLIEQVGRIFQLRRAAIVLCADPPQVAPFGPQTVAPEPGQLRDLCAWVSAQGRGAIHAHQRDAAGLLHRLGFNYVFPLFCQDRLTGIMLLDTSPRQFLDDTESTLLALSSQISLSLESCRLSEAKVQLEKTLLEQQHLATLGGFAATIAHEVKNPLSSIKTLAQLLREDPDVLARYGQELDFIVGETNRLNSSVRQLLTFARPLPQPAEDVALSDLLENTAAFLSPAAVNPGVTLDRRIQPGLKLAASDRKSVEQVVINLLLNALEASPGGGRVELAAGVEGGGGIRIRITDEGPGIPEQIRERVFEPFFTTKRQGTGLGLAIVRKIVHHLGAELEVETPVANGRGTSASVLFPGARVAQP
jgi:signal transduction histidine kinase